MPVFSVCSQVAWLLLDIGLGLFYIWASRGHCGLVPGGRSLDRSLADWVPIAIIQCPRKYWFITVILCGLCMFWIVGKGGPCVVPYITIPLCN